MNAKDYTKPFMIKGCQVVGINYDSINEQYDFYKMGGLKITSIKGPRLRLPKDFGKSWEILKLHFSE